MSGARWATFDCYGTLVDWNSGIGGQLERLFGVESAPRLLARYHELEPAVQGEAYRSYREVLTETLIRLASEQGLAVPEGEEAALAHSLPHWPSFPEVPAALEELRARGWRLAILSNTDRDLIAASERQIGVPFDLVIVAQDIGDSSTMLVTSGLEVALMGLLAELVVRSALFRRESRGHHLRTDHPARDDAAWRAHTVVQAGAEGPELATAPVADDREAV